MSDTSVYARQGSPKWYVSYWCRKRLKRVHEATPWRVDDPSGRKAAMRFAAAKSAEAAAFRGTLKHEVWGAWVEKYLENRYRASPKTHTRMGNAWDWLRVWLDHKEIAVPAALTYHHVIAYPEWRALQKRNCGKSVCRNTALLELKVLSLIMREAIRRGFATANPCERLGMRRDAPKQKPEMTDAEIATIRAALLVREGALTIDQRWMSVAFEIAVHQGCRLSETQVPLTAVTDSTIQFVAKGRNGRPHVFTTTLHPGLRGLMAELRAAGATTTCALPRMASKVWHDFFLEVGLGHLCFHCTRVTVITRLARAGVPIQQAMRFVGHASEAVHQIYQRLKTEDLSACVSALGSLSAPLPVSSDTGGRPRIPGAPSSSV